MFVEEGTKTSAVASADAKRAELQTAPTDWIEREIGELAANIAAATCRWLELVAEFDRRSAHEGWGFHSCAAWLAWRCSIDPRSAREHMRVARALEELSLVRERFSHGELSYSKVRALTRVAAPEIEVELVEMARFATAAQLERLVRGYRRAVSLESAEAAHRDRFLSCEWDEDGSLCIRGRLAPEDGVLFLKALDAGREAIRDREEAGSISVNGADGLMEVAEQSLAGDPSPRPTAERHQVIVHADFMALAGEGPQSGCRLNDGPSICAESARRLACDTSLVPIFHGPKGELDIGHKTRAIPPALRRALEVRDGGRCRFPGCENRRWIDAHHIVHWARGGKTKLDNLVLLCGHHHRLVHEGGFGVGVLADGSMSFRRLDGKAVPPLPPASRGSCKKLWSSNREAGQKIASMASMPLGRGEPFDRELAVAGLLARGPT